MVVFFFLFWTFLTISPAQAAPQRLIIRLKPPQREVYIGQEASFKINLLDRIGLKNIRVIPAEWPNADVFLMGEKNGTLVEKDGTSFNMKELRLSLVAKSAGRMTFPPFCLSATAPTMISARDMPAEVKFKGAGIIEICARPFFLEVKKLPEYTPPLFAAAEVRVFDGVMPKSDSVKAGTPIKRSLLLTAKGTLPAFLPDFKVSKVKNCRIYNGKTERTEPPLKNGLIAALRKTVVFIPQHPGQVVLPEIKVPWLNVSTGKVETAVIPAHTLRVSAANEITREEKNKTLVATNENPQKNKDFSIRRRMSAGLIGCFACAILALYLWRFLRKRQKRKEIVRAVEKACLNGETEKIPNAVLLWAAKTFPEHSFVSLADLRQLFKGRSDDFVQRLEELEQFLYGTGRFAKHFPEAKENLGKDFLDAFTEASQTKIKPEREKRTRLPGLYPDG